jgi:hypothetical protein
MPSMVFKLKVVAQASRRQHSTFLDKTKGCHALLARMLKREHVSLHAGGGFCHGGTLHGNTKFGKGQRLAGEGHHGGVG